MSTLHFGKPTTKLPNGSLLLEQLQLQLGRKQFGPFSFAIRPGEKVAILGPSGAGKSTLLKLMSGELHAQQGKISYSDYPLSHWQLPQLSRYRAVLPQNHQAAVGLSSNLVIALGRVARQSDHHLNDIVQQAAQLAHASHLLERHFDSLSGGEQARIHLARVFAQLWDMQGGIVMVDEPLAALDPGLQIDMLESLDQFVSAGRHAIVAILHDINHALHGFDRLLLVKDGQLVQDIACDHTAQTALAELFGIRLNALSDEHGQIVLLPQLPLRQRLRSLGETTPHKIRPSLVA